MLQSLPLPLSPYSSHLPLSHLSQFPLSHLPLPILMHISPSLHSPNIYHPLRSLLRTQHCYCRTEVFHLLPFVCSAV